MKYTGNTAYIKRASLHKILIPVIIRYLLLLYSRKYALLLSISVRASIIVTIAPHYNNDIWNIAILGAGLNTTFCNNYYCTSIKAMGINRVWLLSIHFILSLSALYIISFLFAMINKCLDCPPCFSDTYASFAAALCITLLNVLIYSKKD